MQVRGVVFTIDAIYVLGIAFVVMAALYAFMSAAHAPDYGFTDSMKVIHDMGEDNTDQPPTGFNTTCDDKHAAVYYSESGASPTGYDYGGAGEIGVCAL